MFNLTKLFKDKNVKESYDILDQLRLEHGLYLASPSEHYSYVWIRDSVYMSLPYLNKSCNTYEKAFYRMLDLFKQYEWKIDLAIEKKPYFEWEYIHARYDSTNVMEINEEWGHIQNDMIGAFLFGIGTGLHHNKRMLRDLKDIEIIQKLVDYLESIEYWQCTDNGMWEENREVHLSSVGACVAGLQKVRSVVDVSPELIEKGTQTLFQLFPKESAEKTADLAQLSLVYPYNLFGLMGETLVTHIEKSLLKERGVIRYVGDSYFSTLEKKYGRHHHKQFYYGTEAEWTFGLPWLALCHLQFGNVEKAKYYLDRTEQVMLEKSALPELYFSKSDEYNHNSPLGWSNAMYILAKESYHNIQKI